MIVSQKSSMPVNTCDSSRLQKKYFQQGLESTYAIVQSPYKAKLKSLHTILHGKIRKEKFTPHQVGLSQTLRKRGVEPAFSGVTWRTWEDDTIYQNWDRNIVVVYELTPVSPEGGGWLSCWSGAGTHIRKPEGLLLRRLKLDLFAA